MSDRNFIDSTWKLAEKGIKKCIPVFLYFICAIAGGVVSYMGINLRSAEPNSSSENVNLKMPEHILIHDTIEKAVVKYRYIYRNKTCCCEKCSHDSIKQR